MGEKDSSARSGKEHMKAMFFKWIGIAAIAVGALTIIGRLTKM